MDLALGYWQVAMGPKSAAHRVLVSTMGHFQSK